MKTILRTTILALTLFSAFRFPLSAFADATVISTNVLPLASYTAGTNASVNYSPPQLHNINSQTVNLYHSATNAAFPTTNWCDTSFDGGVTWTVTATNILGTNNQNEVWYITRRDIPALQRIRTISTTNQTFIITPNWIQ